MYVGGRAYVDFRFLPFHFSEAPPIIWCVFPCPSPPSLHNPQLWANYNDPPPLPPPPPPKKL